VFLLFVACETVPVTGRQQLHLVPTEEINAESAKEYHAFLRKHRVSNNQEETQMVRRVGTDIEHAVERYLSLAHQSSRLSGYRWEFNLFQSKQVNAWCMPGGKVGVYTGIMPIAKDDAGLAVVMGHEIAHAVANHGDERISQELLAQLGGTALSEALGGTSEATQQIVMQAYGVGAEVGALLPYSRLQETEADHMGLIFMALAGYNPNRALEFWHDMERANKGPQPPEILSTHPVDSERIKNIRNFLPEAMKYYTGK